MKSKAPLSLMEQLIMLLVFALAATLCLQVFVLSSQLSRRCDDINQAETRIQNAAEVLKASQGDLSRCEAILGGIAEENRWQISYDAKWNETSTEQAAYQLVIVPLPSELPLLGSAQICATNQSGDILSAITVSWQEVLDE